MYICMHVYTFVYVIFGKVVSTSSRTSSLSTAEKISVPVFMCSYILYIHIYVYVFIYIHTCILDIRMHIYIYIYIHINTCIYIYIYIYICMYIYNMCICNSGKSSLHPCTLDHPQKQKRSQCRYLSTISMSIHK